MRSRLALLALVLALAAVTVWERAAVMHLGSEVATLKARAGRLEDERQALRMALARAHSPGGLARGAEGWEFGDPRTREMIQHVRDDRKPPVLRADARP